MYMHMDTQMPQHTPLTYMHKIKIDSKVTKWKCIYSNWIFVTDLDLMFGSQLTITQLVTMGNLLHFCFSISQVWNEKFKLRNYQTLTALVIYGMSIHL